MRTAIAALALFLATPALAAPTAADLKEEVKQDKKDLKDAKQDLKEIEKLQRKWLEAANADNDKKMARIDAKLDDWLDEEITENREDRRRAKAEFFAMGGTADQIHEPQAHPASRVRHVVAQPVPRRAQDDLEDLRKLKGHSQQTRDIAQNLRGIQPAFTHGTAGPQLMATKATLLKGLVTGAKRDIKRATAELEEDEADLARRTR